MFIKTHKSLFIIFIYSTFNFACKANRESDNIMSRVNNSGNEGRYRYGYKQSTVTIDRNKPNNALQNLMNNRNFKIDRDVQDSRYGQNEVLASKNNHFEVEYSFKQTIVTDGNGRIVRNDIVSGNSRFDDESIKNKFAQFEREFNRLDKSGSIEFEYSEPTIYKNNRADTKFKPNQAFEDLKSFRMGNVDILQKPSGLPNTKTNIIFSKNGETKNTNTTVNKPNLNSNRPTNIFKKEPTKKFKDIDEESSENEIINNDTRFPNRLHTKKKIESDSSEETNQRKPISVNTRVNNYMSNINNRAKDSSPIEKKTNANSNKTNLNDWYKNRMKNNAANAKQSPDNTVKKGNITNRDSPKTPAVTNRYNYKNPVTKPTTYNRPISSNNATGNNTNRFGKVNNPTTAKNTFQNNNLPKRPITNQTNARNNRINNLPTKKKASLDLTMKSNSSTSKSSANSNRKFSKERTIDMDSSFSATKNYGNVNKNFDKSFGNKKNPITARGGLNTAQKTSPKRPLYGNAKFTNNRASPPSITKKNTFGSNVTNNENFRNINIVWDTSILKKNLAEFGEQGSFQKIQQLLIRVDNAMKKFISIRDDVKKEIEIPKNFQGCRNNNSKYFNKEYFPQAVTIDADLLIFVYAMNEDSPTLAAASPCIKNENKRTYIGRMVLNINKLEFEYEDYYHQINEIYTVFHETLHILAFHDYVHSGFTQEVKKPDFPAKFQNLRKMKAIRDDPLEDNAHWNQAYLPTDLMAPFSRIDGNLTIFSMEYLDLVSDEIRTNRSSLPNNFQLDEINNFDDYFSYQCSPKAEKSKYSSFCTQKEVEKDEFGCDRSRMFKSYCGEEQLENGCYERISHDKYVCSNPNVSPESKLRFETYGRNSRCFEGVLKSGKHQSLCLEFEINNTGILVKSQGKAYQCREEGELISMRQDVSGGFYEQKFICPDPVEFKRLFDLTNCENNCYGNGFCTSGTCNCFDGFNQATSCRTKLSSSSGTSRFTNALGL